MIERRLNMQQKFVRWMGIFALIFAVLTFSVILSLNVVSAKQCPAKYGKISCWLDSIMPGTLVGKARGCSVYQDEWGKVMKGRVETITCSGREALVNLYRFNSEDVAFWLNLKGYKTVEQYNKGSFWDDVTYIGEWEAPVEVKTQDHSVLWECYYCPTQAKECSEGQKECISSSKVRRCIGGYWQEERCGSAETCSNGECKVTGDTPVDCTENWQCSDWGECQKDKTKTRTCTDLNNCGTTKNKPAEIMSCIPEASSKTRSGLGVIGLIILSIIAIIALPFILRFAGTLIGLGIWGLVILLILLFVFLEVI